MSWRTSRRCHRAAELSAASGDAAMGGGGMAMMMRGGIVVVAIATGVIVAALVGAAGYLVGSAARSPVAGKRTGTVARCATSS